MKLKINKICINCGTKISETGKTGLCRSCAGKKSNKGKNNPMYGVKRFGKNNPFYGKHHTKETKEKISEAAKRRSGKNSFMYGKHHSEETKKKMSEARKKRITTEETKKKMSIPHKGMARKHHTEEAKKKMRIAAIKRMGKEHKVFSPNYNKNACNWFKFFDKINNTKGIYAPNEYLIEELGYYPDYINFDMKLIIEWDEKHHKQQIEKDVIRQKEIMKHFPEFEFMRISLEKKNEIK